MEDPPQPADQVVIGIEALSRRSDTSEPSSSEEQSSDVVGAEKLHVSMMKRVEEVPGEPLESRPVTIFRLPSWFHEKSKELCEPKMVSIGPFHHGKASLRSMEEHKWSTLRDFLARNNDVSIEYYLNALRSLEAEARQCYSESVNMDSDQFVMMLLLDGCFMLEWFTKHNLGEVDVVCSGGWAMAIFSDMCLLENQLPFFVIHKLKAICDGVKGSQNCKGTSCPLKESENRRRVNPYARMHHDNFLTDLDTTSRAPIMEGSSQKNCPLLELTFQYLPLQFKFNESSLDKISSGKTELKHLLHFYYQVLLSDIEPRANKKEDTSNNDSKRPIEPTTIRCVTELHNAGVTFKKREGDCNLLDITFHKGTILMPSLSIQSDILAILWNMVAFEQSYHRSIYPPTLSSYLVLMDSLIDTQNDVVMLERSGIIKNFFPTTEEAAAFFNQFADNFSLDSNNHHFYELFKQVNEYSESTWHKHRARLMQDYFSNPWSIISVIVAAILLILTFLQTYFSAPK